MISAQRAECDAGDKSGEAPLSAWRDVCGDSDLSVLS